MKPMALMAYAALGLPLAMAALPVYVAAPQFYGAQLGLNLATLGTVLFLARLLDTAQDPFLGRLTDVMQRRRGGWVWQMALGAAGLALGFVALFCPPKLSVLGLYVWLAGCLAVVYTAHSAVNIAYLAWGARLTDDIEGRARVSAWREAAGLLGVVLASALPVYLVQQYGPASGYGVFALLFVLVLAVAAFITLRFADQPLPAANPIKSDWRAALAPKPIRKLLLIYGLNALAVSIPATLVLFYVSDVLRAEAAAGRLLTIYFAAGALTLPCWVMLADLVGKPMAWLVGMLFAYGAFFWASGLGEGDVWQFTLICAISGMALGADLALPPALLADLIPAEHQHNTGLYFGVWAMIGKLALALAAGIALPLLHWLGYVPGQSTAAAPLALVYAALPCVLKLISGALLFGWRGDFDAKPFTTELAA